jgi:hypothetical protein
MTKLELVHGRKISITGKLQNVNTHNGPETKSFGLHISAAMSEKFASLETSSMKATDIPILRSLHQKPHPMTKMKELCHCCALTKPVCWERKTEVLPDI